MPYVAAGCRMLIGSLAFLTVPPGEGLKEHTNGALSSADGIFLPAHSALHTASSIARIMRAVHDCLSRDSLQFSSRSHPPTMRFEFDRVLGARVLFHDISEDVWPKK